MRADLDKQSSELSIAVRRACLSEVQTQKISFDSVMYTFPSFPAFAWSKESWNWRPRPGNLTWRILFDCHNNNHSFHRSKMIRKLVDSRIDGVLDCGLSKLIYDSPDLCTFCLNIWVWIVSQAWKNSMSGLMRWVRGRLSLWGRALRSTVPNWQLLFGEQTLDCVLFNSDHSTFRLTDSQPQVLLNWRKSRCNETSLERYSDNGEVGQCHTPYLVVSDWTQLPELEICLAACVAFRLDAGGTPRSCRWIW